MVENDLDKKNVAAAGPGYAGMELWFQANSVDAMQLLFEKQINECTSEKL